MHLDAKGIKRIIVCNSTKKEAEMQFECNFVPIDSIRPYENNPRFNDNAVDGVAQSIKNFGWQSPIVVDENNVIINGHTRFKAAKKLGMSEVPVHVAKGLSEAQVHALRIADNKTGEVAEWETQKLLKEFEIIIDAGMNVDATGFTEVEIQGLEDSVAEDVVEEGETDPDSDIDVPENPVSEFGKVYQLGGAGHRAISLLHRAAAQGHAGAKEMLEDLGVK